MATYIRDATVATHGVLMSRGGLRGSLLGSLESPFLKLATYQHTYS